MQSKVFSTNKTLNAGGTLVDLSIPIVMGILNVTPDSFYSGSRFEGEKEVLEQTEKMLAEGATVIDIGAYSSRPGAQEVPLPLELERSVSAIKAVIKRFPEAIISIDTFRSPVAKASVNEGATMINDISGGSIDPDMIEAVSQLNVPYIIMHMRGTPQTMQQFTDYKNIVLELADYFNQKIEQLHQKGIKDIIIDPGFGFSKTIDQNFKLLDNLDYLGILEKPILVGISRKSMIWKALETNPENALNGTTALHAIALYKGANILRTHDVKEAMETIKLITQLDP